MTPLQQIDLLGTEPGVTFRDGLWYCRSEFASGVGRLPDAAREKWRIAEAERRNRLERLKRLRMGMAA